MFIRDRRQPNAGTHSQHQDDSECMLRYLKKIDTRTSHTDVQMSEVHKQLHTLNEGLCRTQAQVNRNTKNVSMLKNECLNLKSQLHNLELIMERNELRRVKMN